MKALGRFLIYSCIISEENDASLAGFTINAVHGPIVSPHRVLKIDATTRVILTHNQTLNAINFDIVLNFTPILFSMPIRINALHVEI